MEVSFIDNYILSLSSEKQETFLFLRQFILDSSNLIEEKWKYKLPFFYYKNKPLCYIYSDKISMYISFMRGKYINHSALVSDGRKYVKLYRIDPTEDIDTKELQAIIEQLFVLY